MSEKALGLLGLMRRADAIRIGEENTGETVKAGKGKLLLLASDASDNAVKRAESFTFGHSTVTVKLPYTKEALSDAVGVGGCSMAAVTDLGFANALMKILKTENTETYGPDAEELERRFLKNERRKAAKPGGNRNKNNGKRRTDI